MNGLDVLRGMQAGELPGAPIAETLGMDLVEVDEGRVVFEADPTERLFNPAGTVHGGFAATMLDSAMACAVHTTLPEGDVYTTVDLSLKIVRTITPAAGRLRAEGTIVHVGGRVGTAEGRLTGADGRLYAHGSTTCFITRGATR
ncbi:MAG TPA: PaaI family thioesterase [Acidimicrobiales bacterium]|nr:PaaI family thioesterase [Acidimicrobiales bacterium]